MLVCVFLHKFAHETAGAARIRLSLRPLFGEGKEFSWQTSGAVRRENAESRLAVIASAAKQSTYPLAAPWIASQALAMTADRAV
jgi:hypothetical protein